MEETNNPELEIEKFFNKCEQYIDEIYNTIEMNNNIEIKAQNNLSKYKEIFKEISELEGEIKKEQKLITTNIQTIEDLNIPDEGKNVRK